MRLSLSSSTSSTSYPHALSRSSHSQMFFKIGVLKACHFIKKRLQHSCFFCHTCEIFKTPFFTEDLRWLLLSTLLFLNVSTFTSPLPHFHYSLTVPLLSSFEETLSLPLHHQYHNSRMIHQDCCNRYDLLHCHFHDSYTYLCFDGVYVEKKKNHPCMN